MGTYQPGMHHRRQIVANGRVIGEEAVVGHTPDCIPVFEQVHSSYRPGTPVAQVAQPVLESRLFMHRDSDEIRGTCTKCGTPYTISKASWKMQCMCECGNRVHGEDGQPVKNATIVLMER